MPRPRHGSPLRVEALDLERDVDGSVTGPPRERNAATDGGDEPGSPLLLLLLSHLSLPSLPSLLSLSSLSSLLPRRQRRRRRGVRAGNQLHRARELQQRLVPVRLRRPRRGREQHGRVGAHPLGELDVEPERDASEDGRRLLRSRERPQLEARRERLVPDAAGRQVELVDPGLGGDDVRRLDGDDGAVPRPAPADLPRAGPQVEAVDVVPEGEVAGRGGDAGDGDGGLFDEREGGGARRGGAGEREEEKRSEK